MGPRAAIALAIWTSLFLCGCADSANGNYGNSDLSYNGSDMGAPTDGAFCNSIVAITGNPGPDVPGGFLYAPLDLIATATANTANLEIPQWNVSLADGSTFVPEVIDTASGLTVRFFAPLPGSYTFRVTYPNADCRGMSSVDVHSRDSKSVAYKLRLSPPPSAGVPQQDQTIVVFGGTPQGAHDLPLLAGTILMSTLRGPGATPIAGEVRFLGDNGPDALAVAGANGAFAVAANNDLNYTPLLIPADSALAPRLLAKATGAQWAGASFTVDAGGLVSGSVSDPGGAAIAGARLVLHAGRLPSGTGISAADGSYSLRAQPGDYTGALGAAGWPEVSLPQLTVPASLDVKYSIGRVTVTAKVMASNGPPIAGARVSIRSASLAAVATVTIGGTPQTASGRVKQVAVSAADGTLPPLQLPLGDYQILVEPPAGAADGVTVVSRTLAGADTWMLTLQPKNTLSGKAENLLGQGIADVKVTAFETAGLGAAPSTHSHFDGNFSLSVDPGSPVELLFEPTSASNLSSVRLPLPAGATSATAALPPGLRVSGYVIAPGGGKLPSVVVEALCASCGSQTPIASAISDGSGAYALYLPDPGLDNLDGGVADLSP